MHANWELLRCGLARDESWSLLCPLTWLGYRMALVGTRVDAVVNAVGSFKITVKPDAPFSGMIFMKPGRTESVTACCSG